MEDKIAMLMSIIEENEKVIKIEELGDELEYKVFSFEQVCRLINKLLELALKEKNTMVQEAYFHTINIAINVYNVIDYLNLKELINRLDALNDELLDYALSFIGKTKDKKYEALLIQYLSSSNDMSEGFSKEDIEKHVIDACN